jgi:glucose-1-phosphate cytidylyltransferase
MKCVILAGGLGTRIAEESHLVPKPLIEIGGKPILWHIMKIYSSYGINDFIICCGYKGYKIKEYFANYFMHMSDVTYNIGSGEMDVHKKHAEPWRVTLLDTGEHTSTGGRLKRIRSYLDEDDFCFTYGDGVADIDIRKLIAFHKDHGRHSTVTAVQPPGRFGALQLSNSRVESFLEKPLGDGSYINGGFFVLSPRVVELIEDDATVWEQGPLEMLAGSGNLYAYKHNGFWQPMDTLRDKHLLEQLWRTGDAPWKVWG